MATRPDIRMPERERIDLHIHLPTRTVVKVLLTLIAAWAGLRLWPEFVLLLISLLVAVALHPVVTRLERRGLGRATIVGVMTLIMCAVLALLITVVFTSLAEQLVEAGAGFSGAARSRRPAVARALSDAETDRARDLRAAVVARGRGAAQTSAGARHRRAVGRGVDVLHAGGDDLPAARRQAPLRLAHRLHPARAPRPDGDDRRGGVRGRVRVRARAGDRLGAVHGLRGNRAVGAGRAGRRAARDPGRPVRRDTGGRA